MGILSAVVFFFDYKSTLLAPVNLFFMHWFTDTVFLQSYSSTLHDSITVCYCNVSHQDSVFGIGQKTALAKVG